MLLVHLQLLPRLPPPLLLLLLLLPLPLQAPLPKGGPPKPTAAAERVTPVMA